jgi:hypothetical protein
MIIYSLDASKLVAMSSCIEDRNGGVQGDTKSEDREIKLQL